MTSHTAMHGCSHGLLTASNSITASPELAHCGRAVRDPRHLHSTVVLLWCSAYACLLGSQAGDCCPAKIACLCGTKVHQPIVCAGSRFHVDALPLLAADTEIQVPQIVNGVNRWMFMYSVRVLMFNNNNNNLNAFQQG